MDAASRRTPTTLRVSSHGTVKAPSADESDIWQHEPDELVEGKYRLVRPLGRGGMAEVWLAAHVHLKTELAIKFLSVTLTGDPERSRTILERFRFEAQISARLSARTRHIVAVYDAGVHDDIPYLVMEYVKGRTLYAEVTEKGPIDPLRFADLLDQIADALTVAHELGIVHRDLKPSNVMLFEDPDGAPAVKVADFGIAKAIRGNLGLDRPKETDEHVMLGSPNYMSPEQLTSPLEVDAHSDIWALGVLAYEVLTDWPPFQGDTIAEIIIAISTREIEPATKIRRSLPRGLDGWFARALAKEPARRFASVGEMARAYRAALSASPARARRPVAALAAVALASASTVAAAALVASRFLDAPRPAQAAARRVSPGVRGALQELASRPPSQLPSAAAAGPSAAAPAAQPPAAAEAPVAPPAPEAASAAASAQPRSTWPRPAGDRAAPRATATAAPRTPPPPAIPRRKEIDKSEIL
ncbi:serine/threonine-protein kinase [Sorangium sp. So ce131]|uniref:serine/threonine-protein kinase n=1 Tax=Sorangium sp. So ce131 TaxID=3133282 RepID=UPI003F5E01FB